MVLADMYAWQSVCFCKRSQAVSEHARVHAHTKTEENKRTEELISTWSNDSIVRDRARTSEIVRLSKEMESLIAALEADVTDR
jgi:hypothetical protein